MPHPDKQTDIANCWRRVTDVVAPTGHTLTEASIGMALATPIL